jgi:hypothetical protein
MKQKPGISNDAADKLVRGIKRKTRKHYSAEERIRIVLAGLRRVAEVAQRIALISAIGPDPVAPVLGSDDFDIGHAIARWSACEMVRNIADNQTERDVNDVERFIQEAGKRGRSWREVQRRFRRVKARYLRDIFEGLEREGSIRVETHPFTTGGYPNKVAFPA